MGKNVELDKIIKKLKEDPRNKSYTERGILNCFPSSRQLKK